MKAINRVTGLMVLILTALVPIPGQSRQNSSQEETVVVSSNLVTVNAIVTDSKGRYVKGLNPDQFSIYAENAKQKIVHFSVGATPVSIGIVCAIHNTARGHLAFLPQGWSGRSNKGS